MTTKPKYSKKGKYLGEVGDLDKVSLPVEIYDKTVGIKQFQANLTDSFPEKGATTTITKRNVPTYEVSNIESINFASLSAGGGGSGSNAICSACGQEIIEK